MSEPPSVLYADLHSWLLAVQQTIELKAWPESAQITDVNERGALAHRARRAARYCTALADRLELFDA